MAWLARETMEAAVAVAKKREKRDTAARDAATIVEKVLCALPGLDPYATLKAMTNCDYFSAATVTAERLLALWYNCCASSSKQKSRLAKLLRRTAAGGSGRLLQVLLAAVHRWCLSEADLHSVKH